MSAKPDPSADLADAAAQAPYRMDPSGGCPHAANATLLARGAVAPVVLPGEVEAMAVIGHDALKEFLSHPDVAKGAAHFTALREGRIPDGWPLKTFATVQGMTTADGDDHRRLRSLVSKAFTSRRVEALRGRVEEVTAELLDGLAATESKDGRIVDLRADFALPLPMGVICELLGVDEKFQDQLHHLSNQIVATDISPEDAMAANRDIVAVLSAVAASRTENPGEDLTSALIAVRDEDGDRLSGHELIGTLLLMIIAGHETTLNLITNAVRALCRHRDQLELVQNGKASWSDVVEETLRWDSPVSFFPFRYPTRDLTVDGTVIPKGTPVLAGYSAAGRDKAAHGDDAAEFDVTRYATGSAARHLSLGHGAHFCLGSSLARMEATIALERLFTRFPDLDVAVTEAELPRHASFVGNSVQRLPVTLG
ncbi:cytochrome P450 [Streptomyces camponoticapitis]|uniref:Cytochrome P450 n=1 Tax=Streptomyces camponoticapitis TaxID=1616125 RepID=A0ABQ2EHG0_9ACTN|nr:cytochrome P450 [Streptomyces camponoticapitis]GGK09521.1 cytochrome P450 [Streptomyces camponoticapitis]